MGGGGLVMGEVWGWLGGDGLWGIFVGSVGWVFLMGFWDDDDDDIVDDVFDDVFVKVFVFSWRNCAKSLGYF